MHTLLSCLPLALYFMGTLAATSVVGLVCYNFMRWLDAKLPDVLAALEFIFVWLGSLGCIALLMDSPSHVVGVGILAAICGVGTFAERAVSPLKQHWSDVFLRMLFTTACCAALSFLPVALFIYILPRSVGPSPAVWIEIGSLMGAFCSPSVIPIFMWAWRSMEMRPGVDRHLESEEVSREKA